MLLKIRGRRQTRTMAKSTNLSDLEQRISDLTRQIKERFTIVNDEVTAGQKELDHLSEQYQRLTGKALLNGIEGTRAAKPARKAKGKTKVKAQGKRTRKPGVSVEWIQEHLARKGATVRQLQDVAEEEGLSGLRIPEILRDSKGKFRSQPGDRVVGRKGIPAAVWTVK
jgi:hypothetical protein